MTLCKSTTYHRQIKSNMSAMTNIFNNEKWNSGTVEVHVDPPLIPLTKIKNNENLDKDFFRIKLRSNPRTQRLDLYDLYLFKITFFDNRDPEEFLLIIRNFNITLEASGTLLAGAKIQHICTLVRGEV